MKSKLNKRIFTSIILLIILFVVNFTKIFMLTVFILCFWICFEFSEMFKKIFKTKANYWISQLIAIIYIFLIFAPIAVELPGGSVGPIFFLYLLLICIFTDIGGYVIGKIFKGKKLTKISPNKTISGSIGSFVFAIFPLVIFSQIYLEDYSITYKNILFCFFVSFSSQSGDLFISFLKRKAKIKDTGKIIYGHGGLLDRIDGIIFAIPLAFIYLFGFDNLKRIFYFYF